MLLDGINFYWHHAVLVSFETFPVLVAFAKGIRLLLLQFLLKLFVVDSDCHGNHLLKLDWSISLGNVVFDPVFQSLIELCS